MTPIQIKENRLKAKMSQQQLADEMGVKVWTVSRWERGERKPSSTTVKLLKIILNSQ